MLYKRNIWLTYVLSVTTGLLFAAALVVPFLIENGLDQAQIMVLQTIFSISVVLLEVPTGFVADRYGRVVSVRLGAGAVASGLVGYSLAQGLAQFTACEVFLGLGFALLSGADEALVYDGLLADQAEQYFRRFNANVQSLAFAATMISAPLGSLLAAKVGIRPVLALDGAMGVIGLLCALWLKEPPRQAHAEPERHPLRSMRQVMAYCVNGHAQILPLLVYGAVLSAITYFGYWLAPAYYTWVGISLAWFGVILAARSLLKVVVTQSHRWLDKRVSDKWQLIAHGSLGVMTYLLLAAVRSPLAIAFMALFDVVQALQGPLISDKLHQLTPSNIRAQVMSVASLGRRGFYATLGPVIGWGIDRSVRGGLLLAAALFAPLCVACLFQLYKKGGLQPNPR